MRKNSSIIPNRARAAHTHPGQAKPGRPAHHWKPSLRFQLQCSASSFFASVVRSCWPPHDGSSLQPPNQKHLFALTHPGFHFSSSWSEAQAPLPLSGAGTLRTWSLLCCAEASGSPTAWDPRHHSSCPRRDKQDGFLSLLRAWLSDKSPQQVCHEDQKKAEQLPMRRARRLM